MRFSRNLLASILCCAFTCPIFADTATQINAELTQALNTQINQNNIPGLVMTYGFDNQPLQTIAVGLSNVSTQQPMQEQTLFMLGSVTKSFVGAAILQQVAAGKISVDETLQDIAKEYGGELANAVKTYPAIAPITVRELLDHTSGVRDDVNTPIFTKAFIANPKKVWTDPELLAIALSQPFFFKPGTPDTFSYTNTDYLLLGTILKSVTHQSITEVFQHLWAQAGLQNIYYPEDGVIPESISKNMALGYIALDDPNPLKLAFQNEPVVTISGTTPLQAYQLDNAYTTFGAAAGGLISTTKTMAQWYRALFQNGKVLNSKEVNLMLQGGVVDGQYHDARYGFGVATNVIPPYGYVVSHNGQEPGYTAIVFYFFQSHLVLAAAINSSQSSFLNPFDDATGKSIPGFFSTVMPILLKSQQQSSS